ncbi:MAG: hypothetical protein HOQ27_10665 [Dermatophilaceae bacterium]|nr:hypothetical protein [Dermatophilaceae bacterium]
MPATDRLLALALTLYEDRIDPSHGQRRDLALDPDLADEWTYTDPVMDFAALAIEQSAKSKEKSDHPQAWRHLIGLREGWEDRKAAKVQARIESAIEENP